MLSVYAETDFRKPTNPEKILIGLKSMKTSPYIAAPTVYDWYSSWPSLNIPFHFLHNYKLKVNLIFVTNESKEKETHHQQQPFRENTKRIGLVLYLHAYGSPMSPMCHWEPFYKWNFKFQHQNFQHFLSLPFFLPPNNRILAQIFQSLPEKSIGETQISFPSYLVLLAWDPHYAIPFEFAALCHFKGHVPASLSVMSPLRSPRASSHFI